MTHTVSVLRYAHFTSYFHLSKAENEFLGAMMCQLAIGCQVTDIGAWIGKINSTNRISREKCCKIRFMKTLNQWETRFVCMRGLSRKISAKVPIRRRFNSTS